MYTFGTFNFFAVHTRAVHEDKNVCGRYAQTDSKKANHTDHVLTFQRSEKAKTNMIMKIFNKPTLYTVSANNLFSGFLRRCDQSSSSSRATETITNSGCMLEDISARPPPAHAAGAPLLPVDSINTNLTMEIPPRRVKFDLTRNETLPNGYGTDPDYLEDARNRMVFWHLLQERRTCTLGNNVSGTDACNDAIRQVWDPSSSSKPVLVLDMDETMIWARLPNNEVANLMRDRVDPNELKYFDTESTNRWVLKRPELLPFLREMRKHYRIFVWTAGTQSYADPILDWIEEDDSFFEKRFFRDSCTETNSGQYVKDLGNLGEDLSRVLILDNNEDAYLFNKANGVPIVDFEGNMQDRELLGTYMKVLRTASDFDDVRHGIAALFPELKDVVAKKRRLVSTLHIGILLFEDEMIVTYL